MSSRTRRRWYSIAAWLVRAVLVAALLHQAVAGDWVGVLSMTLFLALSFAYLLRSEHLPNAFDVLVALSALLNALGFVLDYYQRLRLYDEAAHAVTVFAVTLAFFYLVYRDEAPRRRWVMAVAVFTFGVALGSLWEIAEWVTGRILGTAVVYGLDDAVTDLISNSVGALVAALVALRVPHERGKVTEEQRGR